MLSEQIILAWWFDLDLTNKVAFSAPKVALTTPLLTIRRATFYFILILTHGLSHLLLTGIAVAECTNRNGDSR